MLSWYPGLQQAAGSSGDSDEDDGGGDGELVHGSYSVFYGIAVVCVSIFLFCVLAASVVSVWKAFAFAALAALLLSVAGCFGARFRRRQRSGTVDLIVVTVTAAASATARPRASASRAAGYDDDALALVTVNAPPAFEYECPVNARGKSDDPPAPGAASSCCVVVCSVCLEDVRGGEVVRRVPACRHISHAECIDMWLRSHRTCPMCRCMISPSPPPPKVPSPAAVEDQAPHQSSTDELPPV